MFQLRICTLPQGLSCAISAHTRLRCSVSLLPFRRSVGLLEPRCDFVAEIDNTHNEPTLDRVSALDSDTGKRNEVRLRTSPEDQAPGGVRLASSHGAGLARGTEHHRGGAADRIPSDWREIYDRFVSRPPSTPRGH